ncbi:MAG TPA: sulfatase-like hydrolase/transferase, partial [Candidatus Saccharimonadales bacterium]|nr:sulfatase-like hydrolase/transferase [Candidatus Saccharimonadales bacterium]
LTYLPASPHNPFDGLPDRFRKRQAGQFGDLTSAYLNSLNYMDWIISSLIGQLRTSGLLDKTLIVITDDHGEMLGQNGGPVGHGWVVTPRLTNIPLIIMDPARQSYTVNDTIGSQVDLLPTILDRLHIPLPAGQIYQGTSLYSSNPDSLRFIYLNSLQQFAVIKGRELVCGDGESSGTQFPGSRYVMSNQDAQTIFTQIDDPDFALPTISQFNEFQENFLANYGHYCRLLQ